MSNIFKESKTKKEEVIELGNGEIQRNFEEKEEKKNG